MQQFQRGAEFVRVHYQTIIITAVIAGLASGVWNTTPGRLIQQAAPTLTFLMILSISITITPEQLALVTRRPWVVIAGLALNFVFMPLLCWGLASVIIDDPLLATGVMLVGVVPCAGMAAVWTALLKGDVPVSMAINALTMVLAPFLIPPMMTLLAGTSVAISPTALFGQLLTIVVMPLGIGIVTRWWAARRWDVRPVLALPPAFAALMAMLLMFAVCSVNMPLILSQRALIPALLVAVAPIFPIGFLVPHWLGRFGLTPQERIAVTYASGMKNLPIAAGLAFTSFAPLVALPVALAMIAQMLTASVLYRVLIRQVPVGAAPQAPRPRRTKKGKI